MIQCNQCEHFVKGPDGQIGFRCDPFSTIKEPECLMKWQLLRTAELNQRVEKLVTAYESTLAMYRRMAPLQEKMMRHMEKEIDEQDETDAWKYEDEEDDDEGKESER